MPFKSDAQRKKMNQLASEGKISKKTINEFNEASKGKDLPERVTPKKPAKFKSLDQLKTYAKKIK